MFTFGLQILENVNECKRDTEHRAVHSGGPEQILMTQPRHLYEKVVCLIKLDLNARLIDISTE